MINERKQSGSEAAKKLRRCIEAKRHRCIAFCHPELDSASRESELLKQVQDDKKSCHCEEQTKSATSQSHNLQNSTIMRLLLPSRKTILNRFARQSARNDEHVCHPELYKANQNFCHPELDSGSINVDSKQLTVSSEWFNYNKKTANCSQFTSHCKCVAFTLAEVLITLTIIGIVAAMTIPSLVYSYKKNVIETRLVHFSSMWKQAYKMAEIENGPSDNWDAININDPEKMLEVYNKYFAKHIKTVDTYQTPKGVAFALSNGSGFHLRKTCYENMFNGCLYLTFCVNYKNCKALQDDTAPTYYSDGKEIFSFYEEGTPPRQVGYDFSTSREKLIENCKTMHYGCSTLIEYDGWKIKDGYPIKL